MGIRRAWTDAAGNISALFLRRCGGRLLQPRQRPGPNRAGANSRGRGLDSSVLQRRLRLHVAGRVIQPEHVRPLRRGRQRLGMGRGCGSRQLPWSSNRWQCSDEGGCYLGRWDNLSPGSSWRLLERRSVETSRSVSEQIHTRHSDQRCRRSVSPDVSPLIFALRQPPKSRAELRVAALTGLVQAIPLDNHYRFGWPLTIVEAAAPAATARSSAG
jgi:hypothetical protein